MPTFQGLGDWTRKLRRLSPLCLAALLVATACSSTASGIRLCSRVIDGDTIELDGRERVRLIGVDTPETKDPRRPVEYFGKEATAFTKSLVLNKRIRLEYDAVRRDKYGRTLAYVFLEDGTHVNLEIIRQGYGHAYTSYPFRYLEPFREAQRQARLAQRGLWATPQSE